MNIIRTCREQRNADALDDLFEFLERLTDEADEAAGEVRAILLRGLDAS